MRLIRIHSDDTVAVALADLTAGQACPIEGGELAAVTDVPANHKIALVDIPKGADVIKFGRPIGRATAPIRAGEHVHTHNLTTNLHGRVKYDRDPAAAADLSAMAKALTFDGYVRADGRVGIRNEIWILPTVGCVNGLAETLAREAHRLADGTDGVYAFGHPLGCSQLGDDHRRTQEILAALARHPNAGGVLVLGLGCENNHIAAFREVLGPTDPQRVAFLNAQDETDEIARGLELLEGLVHMARVDRRETVPAAKLCVGLKCGGSDALSGVTANPLVGAVSDRLLAAGGATVLSEIPECFGAEQFLLRRCERPEVRQQAEAMIDAFKQYFIDHGQPIDKNPSPGNLEGGITTLEEKSLGCVQKAGTGPIVDVISYGSRVCKAGVTLLDGPGNDMVASTNLAAAGAQAILFTTGRGTPLGAPVPTIKIATNTLLAERKSHWIDFDAGRLLAAATLNELADELVARLLAAASGTHRTANERNGWRSIAIFTDGVTL